MTKDICPRCGIMIDQGVGGMGLALHQEKCDEVPTPRELGAMFLSDPDITIAILAKRYDVNAEFIRRHLLSFGIPKEQLMARGIASRNAIMKANGSASRPGKSTRNEPVPMSRKICPDCGGFVEASEEGGYCTSDRTRRERQQAKKAKQEAV